MTAPKDPNNRLTRRSYTPAEVDRVLTAVAMCQGKVRMAVRELDKAGFPVPPRATVKDWVNKTHAARYAELEREELPRIRAKMARDNEALARQLVGVMKQNIDGLEQKVNDPELSFKERADAQYKLSLSEGIVVDKSYKLRGEADQIIEHRDVSEHLAALKRMGVIEVEAEDVTIEEAA